MVRLTSYVEVLDNHYWYCKQCDTFYFDTEVAEEWQRYHTLYCKCRRSRLVSCAWLLHMNDEHRKLAEINCKSLDKLTELCMTCNRRFKCWTERF